MSAAIVVDRLDPGARAQGHGDSEGLADDDGMVLDREARSPVHVEHAHLHGLRGGRAAVASAEGEGIRLAVGVGDDVLTRRPFEVAGCTVEIHAGWGAVVIDEGETHRVAVHIGRAHVERQRFALAHELQRHGQDLGRLVGIGDADLEVAGERRHAVGCVHGEGVVARRGAVLVIRLRGKIIRRPVQDNRGRARGHIGGLERHTARQVGRRPIHQVEIGVAAEHFDAERRAFLRIDLRGARRGVDQIAVRLHAQQFGRRVACTHHDTYGLRADIGHGRRARIETVACVLRRQAAVRNRDLDVARAQIVRGRRPGEQRLSVLRLRRELGADGEPRRAERERILVGVAHRDRHRKRLAHQGHHLARRADHRRLGQAAHGQHKALRLHHDLVHIAVAIVLGDDGDGVVAAVTLARGEADDAGGCAGCGRILGVGCKTRQAGKRELQRVAVGIHRANRDLDYSPLVDEGAGHIADLRRAVGVVDHDGQGDFAHRRRAGSVAVVGCSDVDIVSPRLRVARRPHEFHGLGIEARANREPRDGVAHRGRSRLGAGGRRGGREADLGFEFRIVRVESEHADAQRLAFEHVPGFGGVEHGGAVGIGDVEHDFARDAGFDGFAVGGYIGGGERDRHAVAAVLIVARRPFEPAGLAVQCGAAGQPGRGVFELNRGAVSLPEPAGHAACELERIPVAFAQRLRSDGQEHRLGVALFDGDVEALRYRRLAVAGDNSDVVVSTCLIVAGRPGQEAAAGVERGAGRKVFHGDGEAVTVGVGGGDRQRETFAFGKGDVIDAVHDRGVVATGDRDDEMLRRHTAAAVLHAHHDFGVCKVACGRGPIQRGNRVVAVDVRNDGAWRRERHAGWGLHQLPEELRAVGIDGFDLAAPRLAGNGGSQRIAVGRDPPGDDERRRQILLRHGIDAVSEVGLDQVGHARARGEQRGGNDGHRLVGERGACGQLAAERLQAGGDIEYPQVAVAEYGAGDAFAEIAARVEQQHQRAVQIVRADVGEAHVVADFAGGTIGAGVAEVQAHLAGKVEHRGEGGEIALPHAHLRGAAQFGADVELPLPGGQAGNVEIRGLGGGIPAYGLRADDATRIRAERGEAEVRDVEHAAGVGRCALPHRLVEDHGDQIHRQRHERAVGHADGSDLRRMDGRDFVDVAGLRDEDAAVRRGDDTLAARAAVGDLQHAFRLQFYHPHRSLVRRCAGAVPQGDFLRGVGHGPLAQVA